MGTRFKEVRRLQGERVRMQFDDGREVVATLLCATRDVDGSRHLIYNKVEAASDPKIVASEAPGCFYAGANTLVNIELADAQNSPQTLHGWDYFDLHRSA